MAYVPPKRSISKRAILCIFLGVLAISGSILMYLQMQQKNAQPLEHATICGLNEEKSAQKLRQENTEVYPISDYQFYGESLNLYREDYAFGGNDDVKRKSIELTNLCNDETITYTMEDDADRRIDLATLEPGFYALSIIDQQEKKRLVYDEKLISEPFTTVKRNEKVHTVKLLADANMTEPALAHNDLFLQVEETEPGSEIDVFIDPYGDRMSNGYRVSAGSGNGLSEAEEMQEAAQLLKTKLESYGLRVAISKSDAQEVIGYYGEEGIMKKAYDSHAKYYLELAMNTAAQSSYQGTEIFHSNYSSPTLANTLMYALRKHTSLKASNAFVWTDRNEGVNACNLIAGEDGQKIYDVLPSLRESGGRITGSGSYSASAKLNADFAQANRFGMQAVSINFIYLSNEEDANTWKSEKDAILTELADAFVKAIHVKEDAS